MASRHIILFSIVLAHFVDAEMRISMNSNEINGTWSVYNANKSINIKATVPGGIYTDLQEANILHDDLLYRFNDQSYRWVGKENWTYQAIFNVYDDPFKAVVNLVFYGIDTSADICLNGQKIGYVNNMFVRHVIPIKDHLQIGKNILQVRFRSPIHESKRLADIQAKMYNIPPDCPPEQQHGECHINFLRKMQASFSWDWGPAFPSVGIWKPVEIEAYDFAIIRDVTVTTKKEKTKWIVNCTSHIEAAVPSSMYIFSAAIHSQENTSSYKLLIQSQKYITGGQGHSFTSSILFELEEDELDLWWPNGYGNQALYKLTAHLSVLNRSSENGEIESMKEIKFGVRQVELVQKRVNANLEGLSFYFRINEVPIFAKGSNWIPGHILPEMGCKNSIIEHALMSAKDANMNMLRVWGGGVYECDLFYELADKLGILIWQDMMFAVALYPTDEKFLKNVAEEVRQQIARLQHHPSIVIWAGNNENEAALRGNWFETKHNFDLYKRDYIKLYVETIEPIVYNIDDSRWYAISSPSNGLRSKEEGYIAENPYSPLYGDVHYYNYKDDSWNASNFVDTRFASEYGYQSMPSLNTLSKVSKASDLKLSSQFTQTRQHHRNGYEEMIGLIRYHLPLPDIDDESQSYYNKFIYYSQISQAMSVKTETEKYRRDRGILDDPNSKVTMGALYWQLNDVWQAPSWSSIEYGGKWKMLHYYAAKFFEPVIISPVIELDILNVYIISDLLHDTAAQLNTSVYSWDTFEPRKTYSSAVLVKKSGSEIYTSNTVEELLLSSNCSRNTCFLHFTLNSVAYSTENSLFLSPLSNVTNLKYPNIKVTLDQSNNGNEITLVLHTDNIAPFLWLDTNIDGQFSDNGFLMMNKSKTITFSNRGRRVDYDEFKKTLKIQSLLT